jgi:SAM-dependent methyltransferase
MTDRPTSLRSIAQRHERPGSSGSPVVPTTSCRACGHSPLVVVLSLGEMPLANALIPPDRLEESEATYPLNLAFCEGCSLAQIDVSVPPEELFSDYVYASSYAESVVSNAATSVSRVVQERGLGPDSLAMEVASNDGYLLQHYAQRGVPVLGIDPAANLIPAAEARGVPTICGFFGSELAEELRSAGRRPNVLHANNVLAHVPDVNGFVRGMARILADDGVAIIETPYVRDLVERLEFDTIYHEHLFYYSLTSIEGVLRRNGLNVVDVEQIPLHGGSLRVSATPGEAANPTPVVTDMLAAEEEVGITSLEYFQGFAERVYRLCDRLRTLLAELGADGRRIAAYGAAAKGAVLLNALGIGKETLEFVADRSPHKHGRSMPGVRVPVVPAERILEAMPDYVLLLAWNHAEEILDQQAEYRNRGGHFIVPVPEPKEM